MTILSDVLESEVTMEMATKKWVVDLRSSLPRHKTRRWKKRKKITTIVIHMNGSENNDPFVTNAYHIGPNHISSKGCPRICYHDFIDHAGTIFHCNDYADWTWHAGWINRWSLGIVMAFAGQKKNSQGKYIFPPLKQYEALLKHLVRLCLYLEIVPEKVIGHREVSGFFTLFGKGSKKYKTDCPGFGIDMDRLRRDLCVRLQTRLASENLYKGSIDAVFGKLSKAALSLYHQNLLITMKRQSQMRTLHV